jgi:hypothetical protein
MKHFKITLHGIWLVLGCCLIHCSEAPLNALNSNTTSEILWYNINTVEEVYEAYPNQMQALLSSINLDLPRLEPVKQAYQRQDMVEALTALLSYYQQGNNAPHLRKAQPPPGKETVPAAETILTNVFTIQNVPGKVPYKEDGHRDWYYKGPNNDKEWAWLSNRHSQINAVLSAYFETGNPKYADYIDLFLKDFIIASWPYPGVKSSTSVWRGLEVAARAKVWSRIFYGLINSDLMSPATRLLMLSSLPDHAHYNRNFHGTNNWLTMEISALATVAANFPEFKQSDQWLEYSVQTMTASMKEQVYPDGVQTELTSHYHNVSLRNFELFKEICDNAGKELPDFYHQTIASMYQYIAHAIRPNGNRILNNDGDLGSDREMVMKGAETFNNKQWEFLASNGSSGMVPPDGPSWFYPWAGQLISRGGYDEMAHWSFFDVGPWGSGHQHNDKLHISVSAFGRDLLVDAGRFAYTGEVAEKFRPYARSTKGHNTLLFDGMGQKPDTRVVEQPLSAKHYRITEDFDYAWNSFDQYQDIDHITHTRALLYVRGHFWVVVDKVQSDQPRKVEALWHWHPDCKVEQLENGIVSSNNQLGNLQVIPVESDHWNIDFVKGQEVPEIQGWYSVEYNKYEPNTAAIYSTEATTDQAYTWILLPFEQVAPKIKISQYAILKEGIKISVEHPEQGRWDLLVPFADSNLVELTRR